MLVLPLDGLFSASSGFEHPSVVEIIEQQKLAPRGLSVSSSKVERCEGGDLVRSLGGGAGHEGGPLCILVLTLVRDEVDSSRLPGLGPLADPTAASLSGSVAVALLGGILGRLALGSTPGSSSRGRVRG